MRIISQDGTFDIPYEMVVIQRFEEKIYFLNQNLAGVDGVTSDLEIAEYSGEEKAKKAMEELREQYRKYVRCNVNTYACFRFPQDEEIEV